MFGGLVMDWQIDMDCRWIGRLVMDLQICRGFALDLHWILGLVMDWHIGDGLADWYRIGVG